MPNEIRVIVRDAEGQEQIISVEANSNEEAAETAVFLGWQFVGIHGEKEKRIPLYATMEFHHPQWRVGEVLSVVTAQRVYGTGMWSDFKIGVRDAFGGRSATGEQLVANMIQELRSELQQAAAGLGAQIVLGFQFRIDAVGEGAQRMFYGTAYGSPAKIVVKQESA